MRALKIFLLLLISIPLSAQIDTSWIKSDTLFFKSEVLKQYTSKKDGTFYMIKHLKIEIESLENENKIKKINLNMPEPCPLPTGNGDFSYIYYFVKPHNRKKFYYNLH